jgi:hypothetical protein
LSFDVQPTVALNATPLYNVTSCFGRDLSKFGTGAVSIVRQNSNF